jgi:hypothetical protein
LSAAGNQLAGEVKGTDGSVIALSSTDGGARVVDHRLAGPGTVTALANGSVAATADGTIVFSYIRYTPASATVPSVSTILVRRSFDGGTHWTPFEVAAGEQGEVTALDTALVGGQTLLVWTGCSGQIDAPCDIFESRGP